MPEGKHERDMAKASLDRLLLAQLLIGCLFIVLSILSMAYVCKRRIKERWLILLIIPVLYTNICIVIYSFDFFHENNLAKIYWSAIA